MKLETTLTLSRFLAGSDQEIMRDGIYKNAPVGLHWKRLIKACQNDASWEEEGPVRAERALIKEQRDDQLRPERLLRLAQLLEQAQGGLLPNWTNQQLAEWGKECSSKERQVLQDLERGIRLSEGGYHPELLRESIELVLREIPQAHLRSIEGYLFEEHPNERTALMKRLEDAVAGIPYRERAEDLAAGRQPKSPTVSRPLLDIDDDDLR